MYPTKGQEYLATSYCIGWEMVLLFQFRHPIEIFRHTDRIPQEIHVMFRHQRSPVTDHQKCPYPKVKAQLPCGGLKGPAC